ncbi:urease accessory protein [Catenibacillus scindens]|uniref:Urease accessory protein UreF n=1 Tax=Catenibacillus scindens TaxID=673271 RepID=A0A7W8HDW6_9FIRM|nr:urease accessory protein UreF [Catenibacillus scindens]MBB5265887.1 urease accessory protein [Catenibacillus scindens]
MGGDDLKRHFLLLQINDALFPIGGYAHSYGLETYIQKGIVHDLATARKYICRRLELSFAWTDLLAVRLSFEAAVKGDYDRLDWLENVMDASRVPQEVREGSKKLGSRFIKTVSYMDLDLPGSCFDVYVRRRHKKPTCHPCAYGVLCAAAKMNLMDVLSAFLYGQTSAVVTNCVKTIPLSQSDGQRLLASLYPIFEDVIKKTMEAGDDMLCLSAPGFDLRSIEHEYLYSRLYMS